MTTIAGFAAAGAAGILLDVDGTLSRIVDRPESAELVAGAGSALAGLVTRYRVVAAISGRTQGELEQLVDVPGVRRIGSYGLAEGAVDADVLSRVRAASDGVDGAWIETKGATVAIHYRSASDVDAAERVLSDRLGTIATSADMMMLAGKRVLELVPAGLPLKEGAVERIIHDEQLRAVLYAGDDVADLRAFEALDRALASDRIDHAVKVAVRGEETPDILLTAADVIVDGPAGMVALLTTL